MTSSLPLPLGSGGSAEAKRPLQGNPASDRILRGPDCIASTEFAPMPPSIPGYPGGLIGTAIGMRFLRHHGIYQSDVGL
jgi:hypothetical protein